MYVHTGQVSPQTVCDFSLMDNDTYVVCKHYENKNSCIEQLGLKA
jgi:hypothetical protein